jgi:Ca-activated chloride channel family protein
MSALISQFHFLRPWWLLLLLPVAWLGWQWARRPWSASWWSSLCDEALLPHVVVPPAQAAVRRAWPVYLAGTLASLALAGPVWERAPQPVYRDQAALVILLDLSSSMLTADLAPNRLERARFRVLDILEQRQAGQTALIAYAADAFTVTPLTTDAATLRAQLSALEPAIMPRQGSDVPAALEAGMNLLRQAGFTAGDLLLLSDGVPEGQLDAAVALAQESGFRISAIGLGTAAGGPVPKAGGGFMTREDGALVFSRLEDAGLRTLTERTGGTYLLTTATGGEVPTLLAFFSRQGQSRDAVASDETAERWQERGPWLLPPLMLMAALAFRRGLLLVLPLTFMSLSLGVLAPREAQAEWFRTPDQQATEAFEAGRYDEAAGLFTDPLWQATARYREGRHPAVLDSLEGQTSPDAQFIRGNALARLGEYAGAVEAYESALQQRAEFADAKANLELVRAALEAQRQADEEKRKEEEREKQSEKQESSQGEQDQQGDEGKDGEAEQGESGKEAGDAEASQTGEREAGENQQGQRQQSSEDASRNKADSSGFDETDPAEIRPGEDEAPEAGAGDAEQALATEQWLRQVPDDPGGLLRRKFLYQYQQREGRREESGEPW